MALQTRADLYPFCRVRIVNAQTTGGRYGNGDEATLVSIQKLGVWAVLDKPDEDFPQEYFYNDEFEVIS